MSDVDRYYEALAFLSARLQWEMSSFVAHTYARVIDRVLGGETWQEAIHKEVGEA